MTILSLNYNFLIISCPVCIEKTCSKTKGINDKLPNLGTSGPVVYHDLIEVNSIDPRLLYMALIML